jgi:hypothetical protein
MKIGHINLVVILQNVFALLKKLLEVAAVSEIQGATVASIINREIIA